MPHLSLDVHVAHAQPPHAARKVTRGWTARVANVVVGQREAWRRATARAAWLAPTDRPAGMGWSTKQVPPACSQLSSRVSSQKRQICSIMTSSAAAGPGPAAAYAGCSLAARIPSTRARVGSLAAAAAAAAAEMPPARFCRLPARAAACSSYASPNASRTDLHSGRASGARLGLGDDERPCMAWHDNCQRGGIVQAVGLPSRHTVEEGCKTGRPGRRTCRWWRCAPCAAAAPSSCARTQTAAAQSRCRLPGRRRPRAPRPPPPIPLHRQAGRGE